MRRCEDIAALSHKCKRANLPLCLFRPLPLTNQPALLSKSPAYPRTSRWKWSVSPLSRLPDRHLLPRWDCHEIGMRGPDMGDKARKRHDLVERGEREDYFDIMLNMSRGQG